MTRRERRLDQRRRRARARRCRLGAFMVTAGLGYSASNALAGAGSRSSQRAWTEAAFADLLGRRPAEPGVDRWVDRLQAGTSPEALVGELVGSHEFHARMVELLYDHYLGRPPDPGASDWVAQLDAGLPVVDVEASLLASEEYATTDADLVDGLYTDVLGRAADAGGRDHWLSVLASGVPRTTVAQHVLRSREAAARRTGATFESFLGEQPDARRVRAFTVDLRESGDWPAQWVRVAGSRAYQQAVEDEGVAAGGAVARVVQGGGAHRSQGE